MAIATAVAPAPAPLRLPRWQTLVLAVPALATVVCLGGVFRFLLWTSRRGYDITDEGYYFLGARHPADVVMSPTASHAELSLLFAAVRWNIPRYRVAGFVITILAAFVLAAGLEAWRRRMDPDASRSWTSAVAASAAIATASLLGNSWLLTSPSYNTVTNWGLSIGAGAVLVTLAIGDATLVPSVWLAVMGAAIGAVFFAKFTAAGAAGAVFVAVLLGWPLVPFRVRLRWLLPPAAGFALFAVFFFIAMQPPLAWFRMSRLGLWDVTTQSTLHGLPQLTNYYHQWRDDVVVMWLKDFGREFYALTAVAVLLFVAGARRWPAAVLRTIAGAGVAYAGYLAVVHIREYPPVLYHYDVTRFFFGWLLLLGPLALAWRPWLPAAGDQLTASGFQLTAGKVRVGWTLVVLMLFVLPFCGALGTANPLQFGMRYVLAAWFALFVLILGRLSAPARAPWAVPVGLACLSACCVVYLIRGPLEAPYRLLTPLRGQTEDTQIGEAGSIVKVDPEQHAFITTVRAAAQAAGFKPGDDLLGLYEMPGIVYALGARAPGITWWTMGYPGSPVVMERAIANIGPERIRHAYILQVKSSTAWLTAQSGKGINFPGDYEPAGTFTIPYSWKREDVTLWRPKSR